MTSKLLYQFPMGKVKTSQVEQTNTCADSYQFPMGKVKLTSAPAIPKGVKKYQFPMGKVKPKRHVMSFAELPEVSIPYGKG